jgi:aminopeptidase
VIKETLSEKRPEKGYAMLKPRHLERYADVLLWGLKTARSDRIKKGDIILVRYHLAALKLAEILQARLMDMRMHPILRLNPTPAMEHTFFDRADAHQLSFVPPGEMELFRNLNGSIFLYAPESITHLSGIEPARISRRAVTLKPQRDILDKRDAAGDFSWTLCMLPTEALARHAELSMAVYTDQIIKACWLHRQDPVSQWQTILKNARTVKAWLNRMDVARYHVESASIDLDITPGEHRQWIGISGHNIPSFELFLSPDWRGTRGVFTANLPSFRNGNRVTGVRLEFKKGRAVSITATQGETFVRQQLGMDAGAGRVGEFSLTDKRFSKINRFMANTLFDENFGGRNGNCHVALGSSYADTYAGDPRKLTKKLKKMLGLNDSALHWDMVNTEKKRVVAHLKDGKPVTIYENGQFTY